MKICIITNQEFTSILLGSLLEVMLLELLDGVMTMMAICSGTYRINGLRPGVKTVTEESKQVNLDLIHGLCLACLIS